MKIYRILLTIVFFMILNVSSKSQVTNLLINGSNSHFTMTSGDLFSWSYNVPIGATTIIEIWYDVNGNGVIDAGDVYWQSFGQTDGDPIGENGPNDMDITAGAVGFSQPVGLAPGKYIMKFTQNNQSVSVAGTVNPLSSPAHTISGTITPPIGKSAANIFVEVMRDNMSPNFWDGITDANGNYTIAMNSDTAGNPWRVDLTSNPFAPNRITPQEHLITIDGNPSGINFSFILATAQVAGIVKDEFGNIFPNTYVQINSSNSNNYLQYSTTTNVKGVYQLGLIPSDLIANHNWSVTANIERSRITTSKLMATAFIPIIYTADSLVKNLVVYNVNSAIIGKVLIDGNAPGFPMELAAMNSDSAQAITMSDPTTGNFYLPVTNKIFRYEIFPVGTSQYYYYNNVIAHAGNTGIIVNLSTSPLGVKQISGNSPNQYSLGQNYPNPFNPSTKISYDIPLSGHVNLTVYSILGEKVMQLVNEYKSAGSYNVEFNSKNLCSGIYFYQLKSNDFISTRKMILMK